MMDKDKIILQEKENDGQTVYLFYDDLAGVYLAFGLSSYFTTLITNPDLSYSDELQMPVAILQKHHVLYLRQSMHIEDHTMKSFYKLKMKSVVGDAGYEKWLQKNFCDKPIGNQ